MSMWDIIKFGLALYGANELMKGKNGHNSGSDSDTWGMDYDEDYDQDSDCIDDDELFL